MMIIDTDSHIIEAADLWTSRMSRSKWGDLVPHVRWDDATQMEAWFVGTGGPVAGTNYVLMVDNTIGRGSSADIVVSDGSLSRIHTRIVFVDGKFVLQDMGSTNGSIVNGVLVHSHALVGGDIVKLGNAVFRFETKKP